MGDECARDEAWNNYTDSLTKDGQLTGLQYHYCPDFDNIENAGDDAEDELEELQVRTANTLLLNNFKRGGVVIGYLTPIEGALARAELLALHLEQATDEEDFEQWESEEHGSKAEWERRRQVYRLLEAMFTERELEGLREAVAAI